MCCSEQQKKMLSLNRATGYGVTKMPDVTLSSLLFPNMRAIQSVFASGHWGFSCCSELIPSFVHGDRLFESFSRLKSLQSDSLCYLIKRDKELQSCTLQSITQQLYSVVWVRGIF